MYGGMKFLKDVGALYGYHPVPRRGSKFKAPYAATAEEFSFLAADSFVSSGECKSKEEFNVNEREV